MRLLSFLIVLLFVSCSTSKELPISSSLSKYNTVKFEISPYGLIFTDVIIANKSVKSMIDFGDPHVLQISSSFASDNKIKVTETQDKAYFISGESFNVNEGKVDKVKIGNVVEQDVEFASSPGEMESVSKQIGTNFNAVVGWGYFKQYYTTLDYSHQVFELYKNAIVVKKPKIIVPFLEGSSYLIIELSINGQITNALLDTGSPVNVIDKSFIKKFDKDLLTSIISNQKIDIKYEEEDLSLLKDLGVSVILGGSFMKNYILHIDPLKRQLVFE